MSTYQCEGSNGTIACFREDNGSIHFHKTGILETEAWTLQADTRARDRQHYSTVVDCAMFPDVVQAGVHVLERRGMNGLTPSDVVETQREWGHHYSRIWRGRYKMMSPAEGWSPVDPRACYGETYTQSIIAAASLFGELLDLFRYIEPTMANANTYSHRLRELIILACTEVEACWRGVLAANLISHDDKWNVHDYSRLNEPMRLAEWSASLRDYPALPKVAPFSPWQFSTKPERRLCWYQAYNSVKHDRAGAFAEASLITLIHAMTALHIMQCAQWGPEIYSPLSIDTRSPFLTIDAPRWRAGDFYAPDPQQRGQWTADLYFQQQPI